MVTNSYPTETHHGWKLIAFGPDGKLYVPVGAPCNNCLSDDPIYASITRINTDGSGREIIAHGVRNTVGFDWHPVTGELWFTDARGELYPCLGNNQSIQLLPLLRAHPTDDVHLRAGIVDGMGIKARGHDFSSQMAAPQVLRFMSMTGG